MVYRPLLLLCLISCHSVWADGLSATQSEEIERLIETVRISDCIFTRNDVDYTGREAITHIRRKYDYFIDEIDSTERFIELTATKSEISGRPYTVECDGEVTGLGEWLKQKLESSR